jgi:transposase
VILINIGKVFTIPKGKKLTEYEMGRIASLDEGLSLRKIAASIKKSPGVVDNYLANQENYGKKKYTGRPSSLTHQDKRRVYRTAATAPANCNQIANQLGLKTSKWTIAWTLKASGQFQYRKKLVQPAIKEPHKIARLEWARKHMSWSKEWSSVVSSDKKGFNSDGPDGFQYYWHDLRKEPQYFSKQRFGGGGVMVWAGFGCKGKTNIAFIDGNMNTKKISGNVGNIFYLLQAKFQLKSGSLSRITRVSTM